jgi:hypothetical protein
MANKAPKQPSAYPHVRIVKWGPIPGPGHTPDGKSEFIQSTQTGFFLYNDGTEAALSVQLEKLELACGPKRSIVITSVPVDVNPGVEAFMAVRVDRFPWPVGKFPWPLDRYKLIKALAQHFDYKHGNAAGWPQTLTIPISLTCRDWHGLSYRINCSLIFSRLRPTGILRFDFTNIERKGTDNRWVQPLSPSATTRTRNPLMSQRVLDIIDDCLRKGKTPMECLTGKLKNISKDPWLERLQFEYDEVHTFNDVADKLQTDHEIMFSRFKAAYYRRKRKLDAK